MDRGAHHGDRRSHRQGPVTFVPAKAEEKPAEEPKADTEQVLYRVQVGAFAVRANADRMLEKLKAAGFAGFVVKGKK